MVIAQLLADWSIFVGPLFDQLVAPALTGVGLSPAPLRETVINVVPIVAGWFGGAGFGAVPLF